MHGGEIGIAQPHRRSAAPALPGAHATAAHFPPQ
jgi:hypothetical protein